MYCIHVSVTQKQRLSPLVQIHVKKEELTDHLHKYNTEEAQIHGQV
jgi:hypothetical protein